MKILFCGLGSIGRRHLKNVTDELNNRGISFEIDALRTTDSALPDEIARMVKRTYTESSGLPDHYDIAFITNPSALHFETLRIVAPRSDAVFIEKPVFTDPGMDLTLLGLREHGVYYVACPLRRSPVLQFSKGLINEQKPSAVRAVCSSYLPDWRQDTDYRATYSALPKEGGGVRLDLIHEWDYLADLFGEPSVISSFSGRYSALEIESDDIAVYIAQFSEMLFSLHLDYTGRAPRRELELYCADDTIIIDILKNEIRWLKVGKTKKLMPVDVHRAEINEFLDIAAGKAENVNTINRALSTLRLALQ